MGGVALASGEAALAGRTEALVNTAVVRLHAPPGGTASFKRQEAAAAAAAPRRQSSWRYQGQQSTILVYGDGRAPVIVPHMDFSALPNFRNARAVQANLKSQGLNLSMVPPASPSAWASCFFPAPGKLYL